MKWINYKNIIVFSIIFLVMNVFFIAIKVVLSGFILIVQLFVISMLSFFTLKKVSVNQNSIIIRYILQFRQVEYKKEDIDYLQFYYKAASKDQSIILRMYPKKYISKVTLKDWVSRDEIEQLIEYLVNNRYIVKFKGDFYWMKIK